MQLLPGLISQGVGLAEVIDHLVSRRPARGARTISRREACAALVTAKILGWVDF
jgi:hypothetical protein